MKFFLDHDVQAEVARVCVAGAGMLNAQICSR